MIINPKTISVTADAKSQVYGEAAKPLTYQVSGLCSGDSLSGALSRASGDTVGTYPITLGTLANANYTIDFTGANYTITKATYNMSGAKWSEGSFKYDGNEKSVTVSGLPSGVTVAGYTGNTATHAGNYTATVTFAYDTVNYNAPTVAAKSWSIAPRQVTLTSGSKTASFTGTALTCETVTPSGDGFISGEGADYYVTGSQTEVGDSKNTFGYTLWQGTTSTDYDINKVEGTLKVTVGGIDFSASPYEGEYDGRGHGITVAVTKPADAKVMYSLDPNGLFGTEPILFTNATEAVTVYYAIEVHGYTSVTNTETVTITQRALTEDMVDSIADQVYTGSSISPELVLNDESPRRITSDDYTAVYANNLTVGEASVTITGKGNYTGEVVILFNITKATYDMSVAAWNYTVPFTYDRTEKAVMVTGLPSGVTASSYSGNKATAAGSYTASVTLAYDTVNYNAPPIADCDWRIDPKTISVTAEAKTQVYGEAAKPLTYQVSGLCSGDSLSGALSRASGDTVGAYPITLGTLANANYTIDFTGANYTITKATYDMTGAKWSEGSFKYDGNEKSVTVSGLPSGVTVAGYTGNKATHAGNYTATVTFAYDTVNYNAPTIAAKGWSIAPRQVTLTSGSKTASYTGTALTCETVTPSGDGFASGEGADYYVTGSQTEVGDSRNTFGYTLWQGTTSTDYDINKVEGTLKVTVGGIDFSASPYEGEYDGRGHGITVAVTKPTDAKVMYSLDPNGVFGTEPILFTNATEAVTVYYAIEAHGYTSVTNTETVTIAQRVLTEDMVDSIADQVYTGSSISPELVLNDESPRRITSDDYTAVYANNLTVGEASVTITGKGNYTGEVVIPFNITKATYDMSNAKWNYTEPFTYDRTEKAVMVTGLPNGVTASGYSGNKATAAGSYTASVTLSYDTVNYNAPSIADCDWKINPKTISVTAEAKTQIYGEAAKPLTYQVSGLCLGDSLSGSLERAPGTTPGNYSIAIGTLANANYAIGFTGANYTIIRATISDSWVASVGPQSYTGSSVMPRPSVMRNGTALSEYVDFVYSYSDNTAVGTAKVTVNGIGSYEGSVTRTFTITSAEFETITEALDGIGEVTPDGQGGFRITITNDTVEAIEIPDNVGRVTIDLNGGDIHGADGADGSATAAGGDGGPAIRIVATGEGGPATELTVVNSVPGEGGSVIGGSGGAGNPPGDGGAGILVDPDAKAGVFVNVGEGVKVIGGDGGDDATGNGVGGKGGAGVDRNVGTNDGEITGGRGGASENGTGGEGGAGVTGGVGTNNGAITGGAGGASVNGTGGAGGMAVEGDVGTNNGTIAGGAGGVSENGTDGAAGRSVGGDVGRNAGTIAKIPLDMSRISWNYTGPFPYDGIVKEVTLLGLPAGVGVSYSSNTATAPGTYTATAVLSSADYEVGTVAAREWVIRQGFVIDGGNGDGATAGTVSYSGVYDAKPHSISVLVMRPEGAAVTYSLKKEGPYSAANPAYTAVGEHEVWYRISAEGYDDLVSSATVTITPRSLMDAVLSGLRFETAGGKRIPVPTVTDDLGNTVSESDYTFDWEETAAGAMSLTFTGRGNYRGTFSKKLAQTRFTVTYVYNGGAGGPETGVFDLATYYGTALPQPVKQGYLFDGWYESPSFEKETRVARSTEVIADDITLYAKWNRRALWYEDSPFHIEFASTWDGYIIGKDESSAGTIQLKVGKPNRATGIAKVNGTIQLTGEKKLSVKGETFDGKVEITAKDGRKLSVQLYESGMKGDFAGMAVDGARNIFAAKDADSKVRAAQTLKRWQGSYVAVVREGSGYEGLSVTVGNKGVVKVAGTLADGTKVSGKAQTMVGERESAISFCWAKKAATVSFLIWLREDGSVEISNLHKPGLPAMVARQKEGAYLASGAAFHVDQTALSAALGKDLLTGEFLPDGIGVQPNGTKWAVAKAGKVKVKKGEITKSGDNLSGLKLTYKLKDSTFKGSFTAYLMTGGKLKKLKFAVNGVVLNGIGYGTAVLKKPACSIPITIE